MKKATLGITFCFFVVVFTTPLANAESIIPITKSDEMDKVEFDGKWTFTREWKKSSHNEISVPGSGIVIRTAHQDNYIYVMLDALVDTTIDNTKDNAMVCFDAKSDQSVKPDSNDYCFKIQLGSNKAFTLQGSDSSEEFKSVGNHKDLIAVGGTSDENDRYTPVPHATYEFRIPIELLERTNSYGIYLQVFDYSNSITYTWPSEIDSNDSIPSPEKWGIIYSPDKSLPEYDVPILVLFFGIILIIFLLGRNGNLTYKKFSEKQSIRV